MPWTVTTRWELRDRLPPSGAGRGQMKNRKKDLHPLRKARFLLPSPVSGKNPDLPSHFFSTNTLEYTLGASPSAMESFLA